MLREAPSAKVAVLRYLVDGWPVVIRVIRPLFCMIEAFIFVWMVIKPMPQTQTLPLGSRESFTSINLEVDHSLFGLFWAPFRVNIWLDELWC